MLRIQALVANNLFELLFPQAKGNQLCQVGIRKPPAKCSFFEK